MFVFQQVMSSKRKRLSVRATKRVNKRKRRSTKKATAVESVHDVVPPRSPEKLDDSDVDNNGNIEGLIASSEDEEHVPQRELNEEEEAQQLLEEFPYSPSLLHDTNESAGPRRSRRKRTETKRFFPPEYVKVFLNEGGKVTEEDLEDILKSSSDEEEDEEEEDYEAEDDDEEDDEDDNKNNDYTSGYALGC